jgi:signal transduction histidine kinase
MTGAKETGSELEYRSDLSRNALVLVFVPALISTLFLIGMNQLWLWSEDIAEREYRSTDMVTIVFEIMNDLLNYNAAALAHQWTGRKEPAESASQNRDLLERDVARLTAIKFDDAEQREAIGRLVELAQRGTDVSKLEELQPQAGEDFYTRNINQAKQGLAMAVNGFVCSRKAMDIVRLDEQLIPRLREEQTRFQQVFRTVVLGGFVGSFAIMLAILFVFERRIRRKLRSLMRQARAVSALDGEEVEVIQGDGELEYVSRSLADIRTKLKDAADRRAAIVQMVAHDVRSPLMASQLSIDLVAKVAASDLSIATKEKLSEAKAQLKSIIGLVTELLSEAREENTQPVEPATGETRERRGITFGISKKVLLIAIAPLILQTCWLSWVNLKISEVEKLTSQAQQQRDFMLALTGMTLSGLEGVSTQAMYVATNKSELVPLAQDALASTNAYLLKMKLLAAGNPVQERFVKLVEPLIASSEKTLLQFAQSDKVFKEIGDSFERLASLSKLSNEGTLRARDQKKLILTQQIVLDINREKHKQLADSIQQLLAVAIVSTLIFAGFLLALFLANITKRVQTLTNNIRSMAVPNAHLKRVGGWDELHELNEIVLSAYSQLQQAAAQRLAVTTTLTERMREPLELALSDLRAVEAQVATEDAEDLRSAIANIQRVLDLINDLMDIRIIETGHIVLNKTMLHLSSVVSDAVTSMHALAEQKGIELIVEVPPNLEASLDERRAVQVLTNVVSNAIKFSPEHSTVTIKATPECIEISDQGPGVPAELAERIFDSRFQVKPDGKGFGLGLAIAKAIVEAHGGSISVKAGQPTGATFAVTLPKDDSHGENSDH